MWWMFFAPDGDELIGAARGEYLFGDMGCRSCHQKASGFRAPEIDGGILGKKRRLVDGTAVIIDEAYILRALQNPGAEIAEGYKNNMPAYSGLEAGSRDFLDLMAYFQGK